MTTQSHFSAIQRAADLLRQFAEACRDAVVDESSVWPENVPEVRQLHDDCMLASDELLRVQETISAAALLIERDAHALRECSTVGGSWTSGSDDAQADYEEMTRCAASLRRLLPKAEQEAK